MINYNLICDNAHEFEGRFKNLDAYNIQHDRGLLQCPICDSKNVSKILTAPNVSSSKRVARNKVQEMQELRQFKENVKKIQQKVKAEFVDVGKNFAEEARKIHYGEADKKNIYGEADIREVKELYDEGVPVAPLPWIDEKKYN